VLVSWNNTAPPPKPRIWLLTEGEPLPVDDSPRLMRTGILAHRLASEGYSVTWWSSRFDHARKRHRQAPGTVHELTPNLTLYLLDGPAYPSNLSIARVNNLRHTATHFRRLAGIAPRPDLLVASYPFTELSVAARAFARAHGVPRIVDVRDPWPDHLPSYFPPPVRWALGPVLWYYRRLFRRIARDAAGLVSVSDSMLEWALGYAGRPRTARDCVVEIGYDRPATPREIAAPTRFTEAQPLACVFFTSGGASYNGSMLVQAARILEARGERRIRFLISGDGELHPRWRAEAAGLQTVEFTGWLTHLEMQARLLGAHVGLILLTGALPRWWLGNKFFEYLSGFVALVNDSPTDAARVIAEHELGLTIPAGDPRALADALSGLIQSPRQVERYMTNARCVFLERFERGQLYGRYVAYLRQFLDRPRAARQVPASLS
jgi:glycosyltransferase involved in cell wall biosynthesis